MKSTASILGDLQSQVNNKNLNLDNHKNIFSETEWLAQIKTFVLLHKKRAPMLVRPFNSSTEKTL